MSSIFRSMRHALIRWLARDDSILIGVVLLDTRVDIIEGEGGVYMADCEFIYSDGTSRVEEFTA